MAVNETPLSTKELQFQMKQIRNFLNLTFLDLFVLILNMYQILLVIPSILSIESSIVLLSNKVLAFIQGIKLKPRGSNFVKQQK